MEKPCPFCGSTDIHDKGYGIACNVCGVWVGGGTQSEAFGGYRALWNKRHCDYHNLVVPALKEAAEFLGYLGYVNEAVEQALRAIGAEATTDKRQDHASDERRGG